VEKFQPGFQSLGCKNIFNGNEFPLLNIYNGAGIQYLDKMRGRSLAMLSTINMMYTSNRQIDKLSH